MIEPAIVTRLRALGYESGWAVQENEIVLWENDDPQPTPEQLGLE